MKVTNEKTESSQAFLTIEMEPQEVEESMQQAYKRLIKKANVPGFRKGKTPRAILEQYIGRESILEDALNNLVPEAYENAIKEQGIEPFAQPTIEITQTEPVVFKATVPLKPTVEVGDYHGIQLVADPVEITDDDTSATIDQLLHQHATWEPVERAVGFDDLLALDIESNVEDTPFINQQGAQYRVVADQNLPVPGFAEQLLGMKRDEEKEFRLQIPADYAREELVGKEAVFRVRVTEIKQENLPELNDEFARVVNPDFETLDALRDEVSANLRARVEERVRLDLEERAIEAAVNVARVDFPPVLVEFEIDHMLREYAQRLQMFGQGLEEYLNSTSKTEQELREEMRPMAVQRVTRSLVLGDIARQEEIEVSGEEVEAEIGSMMADAAEERRKQLGELLNTPQYHQVIQQSLLTRKTIQRLVDIAGDSGEGEDTPVNPPPG